MISYAAFVRRRYAYLILLALIIGIVIGLFSPVPGQFVQRLNVPLVVVMIFAIGFVIDFRSLRKAVMRWKEVSVGLLANFLVAPLICWFLARVFLSANSDLATGVILVGVVPCAGMALVWVSLSKADVPLASVINAVTMIAAPFLIPLLMRVFAGAVVTVNVSRMFLSVLLTVLLPLACGVAAREAVQRRFEVKRVIPIMPSVSATSAVFLMFAAANTTVPVVMNNPGVLPGVIGAVALAILLLFTGMFLLSVKAFGWDSAVAISFSSGMKNLPIALGIAGMNYGRGTMLPIAAGFAVQMLIAVGFYQILKRSQRRKPV